MAVKPTAKAWLYQPFASAPRSGAAVTAGGVLSILIVTERLAVSRLLFMAVQVSVLPAVSAVSFPRAQPVRFAMPDSGSRTRQRIETSPMYQPLAPAGPVSSTVMTGGVVSSLPPPADAGPPSKSAAPTAAAAASAVNASFRVLATIPPPGRRAANGSNGAIPIFDACKAAPAV